MEGTKTKSFKESYWSQMEQVQNELWEFGET